MIKGLSAYQAAYGATYLKVGKDQPAIVASRSTGSSVKEVEDKVSLSPAALALLKQQAEASPFKSRSLLVNKDDVNPLLDRNNNPFKSQGNLIESNLSERSLRATDLTGLRFNDSDLKGADFSYSVLRNASFARADLTGADFTGADLRGANLAGAKGLTSEQFIGARVDSSTVLPLGLLLE